jgi:hypothetical protein
MSLVSLRLGNLQRLPAKLSTRLIRHRLFKLSHQPVGWGYIPVWPIRNPVFGIRPIAYTSKLAIPSGEGLGVQRVQHHTRGMPSTLCSASGESF